MKKQSLLSRTIQLTPIIGALSFTASTKLNAQTPQLVDTNLQLRTVATNLNQPTSMAFLRHNDLFVLEKTNGTVLRFVNGVSNSTVLDLAVNSASERGLLGIALHPRFPQNPGVYLFWTESSTGADSGVLAETPLLGNRVDRFNWNGSTLAFDRNIIRLRAYQADTGQPLRGNHDGGVLRFGPDGKLYIYFGDNGRRGQMQNLPDGPGPNGNTPDDQFGGPEPDDAHLTGVILRLNDDGSTPHSNPFYRAGALRGGEAGDNLQKVFAYGIRNGFGMAFDPFSGRLWEAQNGDDTFTEINRVEAGANLGWVQIMGPLARLAEFKMIETSSNFFGLQQIRWSPTNIADTAEQAVGRMFMVFEGGKEFGAVLSGAEEVPPVNTDAAAVAMFRLNNNGTLSFELRALRPIENATAAHIHLGASGQNGPAVLFLYGPTAGEDFDTGEVISSGTATDGNVMAQTNFTATIANLAERIRQGRAYVNLHTTDVPSGAIRGQLMVTDREPVSHYSDPEFSWKFEVAPAGIGFIESHNLGQQYRGDMIVGAARNFLQGGTLFRLQLTGNRRNIAVDDPRLEDRVADNLAKFDITESESLLFGTGFGVGTDIQTGPNGNLFVVSLSNGAIYEIFGNRPGNNDKDCEDHQGNQGQGHGGDKKEEHKDNRGNNDHGNQGNNNNKDDHGNKGQSGNNGKPKR
jgi:glucose/arabinose dehydrogenase